VLFDRHVPPSVILPRSALAQRRDEMHEMALPACCAETPHRHRRLLRPRSERPHRRRAAECCDELAFSCAPQAEDHTLPHRGKKAVLCITPILATRLPQRVKSLHYRAAALLSASFNKQTSTGGGLRR
jgi:hypothetical protein